MQRVLMIVGTLVLVACHKSSTAPATANVAGNWSGPISDALLGNGTLTFSLSQESTDSVFGTWTTTYANPANDLSGEVDGHISGLSLTVVLKAIDPTTCQFGPIDITGQVSGAASISGTFATIPCAETDTGTFSVVKQ
jgi:hypothetical protein